MSPHATSLCSEMKIERKQEEKDLFGCCILSPCTCAEVSHDNPPFSPPFEPPLFTRPFNALGSWLFEYLLVTGIINVDSAFVSGFYFHSCSAYGLTPAMVLAVGYVLGMSSTQVQGEGMQQLSQSFSSSFHFGLYILAQIDDTG